MSSLDSCVLSSPKTSVLVLSAPLSLHSLCSLSSCALLSSWGKHNRGSRKTLTAAGIHYLHITILHTKLNDPGSKSSQPHCYVAHPMILDQLQVCDPPPWVWPAFQQEQSSRPGVPGKRGYHTHTHLPVYRETRDSSTKHTPSNINKSIDCS